MTNVVGIRFTPAGKIYDFDSGSFELHRGDHVVVETQQGLGLGMVAVPPGPPGDRHAGRQLKRVFRLASEKDLRQVEKNLALETRAHAYCLHCIRELGLKMNLFAVRSAFDSSKLTFFFTAEGRVDFRKLVKMLVKKLGMRIEMRQVGIRNQAKMLGGIGRCGRELCCTGFMEKFDPVSIRMAKEQSLSLNPTKISGLCGRLMCCLTFEHATYKELRRNFPKMGKSVMYKDARAKVIRHNALGGRVAIRQQDGSEREVSLDEITWPGKQE